ncbi:MAG: hypothetical protein P1V97_30400, partial [Planctomycetota bacterium]|nr:hypothetical protein [Planctomycetota bacterium]
WVGKIHEKLASTTVSFYFHKAPLADILRFFEEKSGLDFVISPNLDPEDFEIDLRLKQVSLDLALQHTLKKAELSYTLKNNVIYIVPLGHNDQAMILDFIGIQDIIETKEKKEEPEAKPRKGPMFQTLNFSDEHSYDQPYGVGQLLDIIRSDTGADSWDDAAFIQFHNGQLIIFQSEDKIHKTREIIARLRQAKQSER